MTYDVGLLQLGDGFGVHLDVVALELADVEGFHDTARAGVARRGRVHHLLMFLAVGETDIWVVLDNEIVGDGVGAVERGGSSRLGLTAEGEPGDGDGCDEVLHFSSDWSNASRDKGVERVPMATGGLGYRNAVIL